MAKKVLFSPPPEEPSEPKIKLANEWLQSLARYKQVLFAVCFLISATLALLIYLQLHQQALEKKAATRIWRAERYAEEKHYKKALKGDGTYVGLLDIIKQYPSTKAAQRAYLLSGRIYLEKAEKITNPNLQKKLYHQALQQLDKYTLKTPPLYSSTLALKGDIYVALKDYPKAHEHYEKAIHHDPNPTYTPRYLHKAAALYRHEGNLTKALQYEKRICEEFPESPFYEEAQLHIGILETLLAQRAATTPPTGAPAN